jgi:hypothetical protein
MYMYVVIQWAKADSSKGGGDPAWEPSLKYPIFLQVTILYPFKFLVFYFFLIWSSKNVHLLKDQIPNPGFTLITGGHLLKYAWTWWDIQLDAHQACSQGYKPFQFVESYLIFMPFLKTLNPLLCKFIQNDHLCGILSTGLYVVEYQTT